MLVSSFFVYIVAKVKGSAVLIVVVSLQSDLSATRLDRPDAIPDGTIRGNNTKQNIVVKATRNKTKTNLV